MQLGFFTKKVRCSFTRIYPSVSVSHVAEFDSLKSVFGKVGILELKYRRRRVSDVRKMRRARTKPRTETSECEVVLKEDECGTREKTWRMK